MTMLPELAEILTHELREASQQVEDQLNLEDTGWVRFGQTGAIGQVTDAARRLTISKARIYATYDPLAVQSIRLWTGFSFGTGMILTVPEENTETEKVFREFWAHPSNVGITSPAGQRKSSDQVLIDGELFFAVWIETVGSKKIARIRRLSALEITQIITDPDDAEDVRYYKREWTDTFNQKQLAVYRSWMNVKDEAVGQVRATDNTNGAVVFHLAINTIGQRGNSLLTPAIDWIKLHRQFLASRAAIMLALARFAWKQKVKGGANAVAAVKAQLDGEEPEAASVAIENEGVNLEPLSPNSRAQNAYQDGRQLKHQVFSAVGWPEHYYGDVSTGNLATSKTVELPVTKQCQTYQNAWVTLYTQIIQYVMSQSGVADDRLAVDIDFPAITPEDAGALAKSIQMMVASFPDFVDNRTVMQQALMAIGVTGTDVNRVLDELEAGDEVSESAGIPSEVLKLLREMQGYDEDEDEDAPGAAIKNGRARRAALRNGRTPAGAAAEPGL